ncbi:basic leucine zipper 43-like [Forsythia ovata]|uniref:Basic leucine zipper 43-like n=1 Tax=Forsythia ovata TaxID=205694 RepID=A0ABD1WA72_9LAMI
MQCSPTGSMQSVKQDFVLSPLIYSTMIPPETTGMNYFVPENPSTFPDNFGFMQSNLPALQFNRFLSNLPNYQISPLVHEFTPNSSCISNNSTSDEADDPQLSIIDERKQRRMISNRESARRSRMRKQKHLDELWAQVLRLRTENQNLIGKLNHVSECHDRILQENARLKEETSDLREMLMDLQLGTSYAAFGELEDVPCNTTYLTTESSN